jgi:hypothetical protein
VTFILIFSPFLKGTWSPHNRRFSMRFVNKIHEFSVTFAL